MVAPSIAPSRCETKWSMPCVVGIGGGFTTEARTTHGAGRDLLCALCMNSCAFVVKLPARNLEVSNAPLATRLPFRVLGLWYGRVFLLPRDGAQSAERSASNLIREHPRSR